jgi:hypothetical protein
LSFVLRIRAASMVIATFARNAAAGNALAVNRESSGDQLRSRLVAGGYDGGSILG